LLLLLAALIVAAAVVWAGLRIAGEVARPRARAIAPIELLTAFTPGIAAAAENPKALLTWQPLALAARAIYPGEFSALDRAYGATFPFSAEQLQAAHSRWTADWLAWECSHDAEYKLKGALLMHELGDAAHSAEGRARLNAVESERVERYQRRYEEYSRIAHALQSLLPR
jgi:hypothetical protein